MLILFLVAFSPRLSNQILHYYLRNNEKRKKEEEIVRKVIQRSTPRTPTGLFFPFHGSGLILEFIFSFFSLPFFPIFFFFSSLWLMFCFVFFANKAQICFFFF